MTGRARLLEAGAPVRRILLIVLGLMACGPASYASSTFEGDDEGWTLANNGSDTRPKLERSGGNPGGSLCGEDKGFGDVWYFVAPRKFLGNASEIYGKRFTFDIKQSNIFDQVRGRDVVLNGGGLALVWNLRYAPGVDWTPTSLRLDDQSNWRLDGPDGALATEADLRTVLADLNSLRIRGDFYDGPDDVTCLDNVYLGRE